MNSELARIRAKKRLTQQNLADQVNITRQMVSAIENGAQPSVKTAKKISAVLGIDWTTLF